MESDNLSAQECSKYRAILNDIRESKHQPEQKDTGPLLSWCDVFFPERLSMGPSADGLRYLNLDCQSIADKLDNDFARYEELKRMAELGTYKGKIERPDYKNGFKEEMFNPTSKIRRDQGVVIQDLAELDLQQPQFPMMRTWILQERSKLKDKKCSEGLRKAIHNHKLRDQWRLKYLKTFSKRYVTETADSVANRLKENEEILINDRIERLRKLPKLNSKVKRWAAMLKTQSSILRPLDLPSDTEIVKKMEQGCLKLRPWEADLRARVSKSVTDRAVSESPLDRHSTRSSARRTVSVVPSNSRITNGGFTKLTSNSVDTGIGFKHLFEESRCATFDDEDFDDNASVADSAVDVPYVQKAMVAHHGSLVNRTADLRDLTEDQASMILSTKPQLPHIDRTIKGFDVNWRFEPVVYQDESDGEEPAKPVEVIEEAPHRNKPLAAVQGYHKFDDVIQSLLEEEEVMLSSGDEGSDHGGTLTGPRGPVCKKDSVTGRILVNDWSFHDDYPDVWRNGVARVVHNHLVNYPVIPKPQEASNKAVDPVVEEVIQAMRVRAPCRVLPEKGFLAGGSYDPVLQEKLDRIDALTVDDLLAEIEEEHKVIDTLPEINSLLSVLYVDAKMNERLRLQSLHRVEHEARPETDFLTENPDVLATKQSVAGFIFGSDGILHKR